MEGLPKATLMIIGLRIFNLGLIHLMAIGQNTRMVIALAIS